MRRHSPRHCVPPWSSLGNWEDTVVAAVVALNDDIDDHGPPEHDFWSQVKDVLLADAVVAVLGDGESSPWWVYSDENFVDRTGLTRDLADDVGWDTAVAAVILGEASVVVVDDAYTDYRVEVQKRTVDAVVAPIRQERLLVALKKASSTTVA
jgi:hypothetical protein